MLTYGKVFYNFKVACALSCRKRRLIYSSFEDQWRKKGEDTVCCSRREKRETQMDTEAEAAHLGSPCQHRRHLGS